MVTGTTHSAHRVKISRFDALDGVKALPLLVVIVAHLGWAAVLPGAWIAINHFFLFSGFVIVYVLLVERARTGSISVRAFYRRRMRRLLPGLFVLLAALGVWGVLFAEDHVRRALQNDILATLGYVMNWRLVAISDQYFSQFGSPSMLRHAWTLSVEEQFYVVVPWLFIAVLASTRKRFRRVMMIAVLAGLSALISAQFDIATVDGLSRAYYGTDVRAQSILVGVGLAFALGPDSRGRSPQPLPYGLVHACAWVSFAVVGWVYLSVPYTATWMWDRGGILLTTLAFVPMMIASVDGRPMRFTALMSIRPFVYVGLMTYGLYLWHWPIERWLSMYGPPMPTPVFVVVALIIIFAAAHLSYRHLETKITGGGVASIAGSRRRGRWVVVSSVIIIVALAITAGRVPSLEAQLADGTAPALVPGTPEYVSAEAGTSVAIFGDSTARYLFDEMPSVPFNDIDVTNLAVPGCDLARIDIQWTDVDRRSPEDVCLEARAELGSDLLQADPDVFLLMSGSVLSVPHVDDNGAIIDVTSTQFQDIVESELDDVFGAARRADVDQLFLATVPCRENDPSQVLIHGIDFESHYRDHPEQMERLADPVVVNTWLRDWAERNGVTVLDFYQVLGCEATYSRTFNGVKVYRDYFHFSQEAAAMIWTWLGPELRGDFASGGAPE